ncbi:MAG: hypothetical protein KI792_09190 [Alphaproteobacteria bacterium]|nr:hypothetical protein [Alphaproteobacteria bacterium SS10]
MSAASSQEPQPRIFIVFSGETELRWLRILKPGFRHCFALIDNGRHWTVFEPLSGYFEVQSLDVSSSVDLPLLYAANPQMTVIEAEHVTRPASQAPPAILSCVEAVKRLIGLHNPLIVTPYQLFRHLQRQQNASISAGQALLPTPHPARTPIPALASGDHHHG